MSALSHTCLTPEGIETQLSYHFGVTVSEDDFLLNLLHEQPNDQKLQHLKQAFHRLGENMHVAHWIDNFQLTEQSKVKDFVKHLMNAQEAATPH